MKGIDQRIAELPPEKLALLLERLGRAVPAKPGPPPIRPRRRYGSVRPLSFSQERLWFLDQLAPGGDYNVPTALRLRGDVDRRAFEQGVREVLRRHEVLRVSIQAADGKPLQTVEEIRLTSTRVDLSGLRPADRETEAERLARHEALRPFDLARDPLLRLRWLDLEQGDRVLLITLHHIVCDAWSVGILTGELVELYRAFKVGGPSPLRELPVQYADYAEWHQERLRGESLERLMSYWRRQLQGATATVELPGALPESTGLERRGAEEIFSFSPEASVALKALGREERTTPFVVLVALFSALLHMESGQTDLCIGANAAHRGELETEGLVGFFVNQVVLRVRPTGARLFRELLRQARDVTEEAFDHQDLPFEKLVETLAPERSSRRNPLFQVKVDYQEEEPAVRWPGVEVSALTVVPSPLRCDLLLIGAGSGDRIDCTLNYDSSRFRPETVKHLAWVLVRTAEIVAAEPEISLAALSQRVVQEVERRWSAERERLDRIGATRLKNVRRKSLRA